MRPALVAQAASCLILAATTDAATPHRRGDCDPLPAGPGPKADPDTVSAFLALPDISNAADSAGTPKGYTEQFSNLQAAARLSSGNLGVFDMQSYDVHFCASKCNAVQACNSFNIYFERDPSVDPGTGASGCADPPSTTTIKCALWEYIVTPADATNKKQSRNKFQVVIAGSNAYANSITLAKQASCEIFSISAQPYCSSLLGYSTPAVTTVVLATSTPLATTTRTSTEIDLFTTTLIESITTTLTNTASTTTTVTLPIITVETETSETTATIVSPTTTFEPQTTTISTETLNFATTTTTTITKTDLGAPSVVALSKRDMTMPTALSSYPGSIITSACSLIVSPVTVTRTATSLSTSTASTLYDTEVIFTTTSTTASEITATTSSSTLSITETGTETTNPVVTITSTTAITQTEIDVPTVTITTFVNEIETTSTTSTVTATDTTTVLPSACEPGSYRFQIIGGSYDGQYVTDSDPTDLARVVYQFVYANASLAAAHVWTTTPDNRVYEYPKAFALSAFKSLADYSSLLTASNSRIASNNLRYVSCTVRPSAAVASVAGAAGLLTCNEADGAPTTFFTIPCIGGRLPNGIYEGNPFSPLVSNSFGCAGVPFTVAAIPVGPVRC